MVKFGYVASEHKSAISVVKSQLSEAQQNPQCRAAEWGWRFGDSSSCLDESSHWWVPARTPTVDRCPTVGGPWVTRSRDQPVSSSSARNATVV